MSNFKIGTEALLAYTVSTDLNGLVVEILDTTDVAGLYRFKIVSPGRQYGRTGTVRENSLRPLEVSNE